MDSAEQYKQFKTRFEDQVFDIGLNALDGKLPDEVTIARLRKQLQTMWELLDRVEYDTV